MTSRACFANFARRLNEVDRVIVMFFYARCDGKDIRVKDDVFSGEPYFFSENSESTLADLDLAVFGVGLTHFIKRHNHDGRAVSEAGSRLLPERLFAFLHGNGVDDRLALNAFQASLDHLPFGRVDHDRDTGNVRLGGDQVQKGAHGLGAIQHAFIHVYVDHLRAALDLLSRNLNGIRVTTFGDHFPETRRTCHIGTFTNVHKRLGSCNCHFLVFPASSGQLPSTTEGNPSAGRLYQ